LTEQNLKLQTKSFSVNNFLSSDKDISYYTLSPDGPTSIFSTLLSSDTGKLVTSGWGDFWEVLFIFLPSCFTWFFSYCLILSLGFFLAVNICIICHRTSRKFKDINFIPFPKKFEIREKWLKALKLTEHDLKASGRVCSFHFFGGERKKNDVPSLEIGEKFGAKS
jgi:hypothetical protein